MILSAIAGNENLATLVPRQIIFGGIGFVVIILAAAIDYRFWSGAIIPMYIVIVIFLLLLFVIGGARFGATRWIETGLVSIQPTELAKVVVILALANYFAKNYEAPRNWRWMVKGLIITLGYCRVDFYPTKSKQCNSYYGFMGCDELGKRTRNKAAWNNGPFRHYSGCDSF